MEQSKTQIGRFEVLDSWRGICALIIALFHFQAYSHLTTTSFLANCYLFVDFFFVLSGFVIAANYQARLAEGFGLGQFMLLRFGRIYPLHLFIFLLFIFAELVKVVLQNYLPMDVPAFDSNMHGPHSLLAQLLFLQSFNFYPYLTWNVPSWSIATEFWTYLLFAIAAIYAGRLFNWFMVGAIAMGLTTLYLFSPFWMNATFDFGIYRCLAGFCAGVLCWHVWSKYLHGLKLSWLATNLLEILVTLNVVFFVWIAAWTVYSIFAPFLFAVVVLVFAAEGGLISRILRLKPFQILGALSYSVYMMHYFIEEQVTNAVKMVAKLKSYQLINYDYSITPPAKLVGYTLVQGDMWSVLVICLVLPAAYFSYYYIEIPSRNWFRKLATTQTAAQIQMARP